MKREIKKKIYVASRKSDHQTIIKLQRIYVDNEAAFHRIIKERTQKFIRDMALAELKKDEKGN